MRINVLRAAAVTTTLLALFTLTTPQQAKEVKPQARFAKFDEMRVHYEDYGKGQEALVFVHGWTCNASFWKANVPAFTDKTRVIAVDLPGHGQSDSPQVAYSMDLFARAIDAVLRDAKVERATLVGHSMGTPVIRQFYRKYPEKTRALVIVDGLLKPFGDRATMEKVFAPLRGPDYRQFAEGMVSSMVAPMKDKAAAATVKAAMLSTPQHVMGSAMDGMLDDAIWQTQDKINVPTLAIMAKQPNRTAEYEAYVRELAPGIDYQVWDGVSHFLMIDEPQKFNETVLAFLRKNRLVRG